VDLARQHAAVEVQQEAAVALAASGVEAMSTVMMTISWRTALMNPQPAAVDTGRGRDWAVEVRPSKEGTLRKKRVQVLAAVVGVVPLCLHLRPLCSTPWHRVCPQVCGNQYEQHSS
jgi:hypothetical protein